MRASSSRRVVSVVAAGVIGLLLASGSAQALTVSGDLVSPHADSRVVDIATVGPEVNALGSRLVNKFFTLLQYRDINGLAKFLAPAFQIQRIDGSGMSKAEYLNNPAKVSTFVIGDVAATRYNDLVVVRYQVSTSEIIDASTYGSTRQPRMSIFSLNGRTHHWQLLMHANFNRPAVRISVRAKDVTSAKAPSAEGLIAHFMKLLVTQDRAALRAFLSPAFQIQRDDGTSANRDSYAAHPPLVTGYALSDFKVTRQHDVIVTRYLASITQMIDGRTVTTSMSPHIAVLARDDRTGSWQLAAYSNLNLVGS